MTVNSSFVLYLNNDGTQRMSHPDGDYTTPDEQPPNTITDLTAVSAGYYSVTLDWTAAANSDRTRIQRRVSGASTWHVLNLWYGDPPYTAAALLSDTTYEFQVFSGNEHGFAPGSNIPNATTDTVPVAPSPPGSPTGNTDFTKLQYFQDYDSLAIGTIVPHVAWPGGTVTDEVTLGGHKVIKDVMQRLDIGQEDGNFIGYAKNIGPHIGEGDELWWRQYHYYPSDFSFGSASYNEGDPGHRKHLRVRQHDAGCADTAVIGPGGNVRGPENGIQGYHEDTGINPNFDNTWGVYAFDRSGVYPIVKGQWSCTEVYIKASKYSSTGRWCVWIDGNLLPIGMINQQMLGTSRGTQPPYYSALLYITHWNGGSPKDQVFYWGRGAWAVRKADGSVDQTPHMTYDPQTGIPFIGTGY